MTIRVASLSPRVSSVRLRDLSVEGSSSVTVLYQPNFCQRCAPMITQCLSVKMLTCQT